MKKEKNNAIVMLQYRIKRYKSMGDGIMCQNLNREMRKLQANGSTQN